MLYLSIGLVVGLVLGVLVGRAMRDATPAPTEQVKPTPPPAPLTQGATTKASPGADDTLRLREREWKQSSADLCTGVFHVVTAPPGLKRLQFSAMDAAGAVIASDGVSSDSGIKPNSVLELGFEVGECSKIAKWKVAIPKE